jgi:hypothetical protein
MYTLLIAELYIYIYIHIYIVSFPLDLNLFFKIFVSVISGTLKILMLFPYRSEVITNSQLEYDERP